MKDAPICATGECRLRGCGVKPLSHHNNGHDIEDATTPGSETMNDRKGAARVRARATFAGLIAVAFIATSLVPVAVGAQESTRGAYPRPGSTSRLSEIDGMDVNGPSGTPSISADGRYVVFLTNATDLVPDDRNGAVTDVVIADRATGAFVRASVSSDGEQGDHYSRYASITPDGRFVVFQSDSTNLVPNDTNKSADVFVHDRDADEDGIFDEPGAVSTERVSVATGGAQAWSGVRRSGGPDIGPPSISPDGRAVVFPSWSDDLIAQDKNPGYDVFLHDRLENRTELISVSTGGTQANSYSSTHRDVGAGTSPASVVSDGGRHVVFWSSANNLVPDDTNGDIDIFVRDRAQQTTQRLSTAADGEQADGPSFDASITPDGRHVVFTSSASNLVPVDEPRGATLDHDTFVRDRDGNGNAIFDEAGEVKVERVNVASDGIETDGSYSGQAAISEDGRYVSFASDATNLVANDTNAQFDVFIRDRQLRITERVSRSGDDHQGEGYSWLSSVSADGRFVGFETAASGLSPTFRPDNYDALLRDRGPEVGVGRLRATARDGAIAVNGWATFSGAVVASAADPGDDATIDAGLDLLAADVTQRVEQQDLLVRIEPDALPRVSPPCCLKQHTTVTPIIYGFEFVTGGIRYQARASAPTEQVPSFRLYRCGAGCSEDRSLGGSFGTTGTEVLMSVPLEAVGPDGVGALEDIRAFATLGPDGPEVDEIPLESTSLSTPDLAVGIAPQGTLLEEVALQDATSSLRAGRFSIDVAASDLAAGTYDVVAKACLGDRCGSETAHVQVGPPVQPQPTGDIHDLATKINDETVRVTGTTDLAEEVVLGIDPVEAEKVLPGSDLTSASITFKNPQTLVFKLDVANLGPMNGVPESLRYGWDLTVTPPYAGKADTGRYELLATRSTAAQQGRAGNLEPRFVLYDSFIGTSGFARRFKREVGGKMRDGVVQWEVLLRDIEAKPGSVISTIESNPILGVPDTALFGVTSEHVFPSPLQGSAYNRWVPPLDHVKPVEDYEVPATKVDLGIAKEGVPDADVELTATGKMATNGFFRGDLPLPDAAGTYKVVAQACLRDVCVRGSTKLVVEPDAVEPIETVLNFTGANATAGQFTDKVTFEAALSDVDQLPIADGPLLFELQGATTTRTFTATTDADGRATETFRLDEPPGAYRLTVRFGGSDHHLPAADVAGFVVEKEGTTAELVVEGRGKERVLVARLVDADDADGPVAGRTIWFYADDRLLGSAETNELGDATFTAAAKYRSGKHIYEAEFAGDDFFRRSSARKET